MMIWHEGMDLLSLRVWLRAMDPPSDQSDRFARARMPEHCSFVAGPHLQGSVFVLGAFFRPKSRRFFPGGYKASQEATPSQSAFFVRCVALPTPDSVVAGSNPPSGLEIFSRFPCAKKCEQLYSVTSVTSDTWFKSVGVFRHSEGCYGILKPGLQSLQGCL